jgi:hypothetical protein
MTIQITRGEHELGDSHGTREFGGAVSHFPPVRAARS